MKCPACGTENRDTARFCRNCGATLAVPVEAPAAEIATPLPEPEPAIAEPPPGAPPAPDEPAAAAEAMAEASADGTGPGAESQAPEAGPESPAPPEQPAEEVRPAEEDQAPDAAASPASPAEAEDEALSEPDAEAFWRENAAPLQPVAAGTVLDDRYAIVEPIDVQADHILYQAQDLKRCWQCGFDGNAPSEAFCARCGAVLDHKPEARLLQVAEAGAEPPGGETVAGRVEHDGQHFLVLAAPAAKPAPVATPGQVRLLVGQRSVPGQVRDLNEDSLLVLTLVPVFQSQEQPLAGLFVVADGMGGHEGGEIASKLVLQVFAGTLVRDLLLPGLAAEQPQALPDDTIVERLREAVAAANDALYLARQKRGSDMGTTLTALFAWDTRLFMAHVGDSRAYRWNASGLQQLSTDHSVVAQMVASGQITADEIYTHPRRSIIYRSIGDKPALEVDTATWPLAPGDRLIVCSDGLWEMIRSEGIEEALMAEADPQAACDLLASRANAAGGEDNISVVVVQVETA